MFSFISTITAKIAERMADRRDNRIAQRMADDQYDLHLARCENEIAYQETIRQLRLELAEARQNSLTNEEMAMYRIWCSDADYDFKRSQAKDNEPWPSPEEV